MCELTAGYTKQNCASVGGVKSIILYGIENRASYTQTANEVTALTMESGKQGFKFSVDQQSASFTETQTRARENNSLFYEVAGVIMVKDDEDATRDLIALTGGGFLGVIAEKESGKYIHYGIINGLTVSTTEIVTGQNYEDMNGATINLTGREKAIAPYLDSTIADGILTPAP